MEVVALLAGGPREPRRYSSLAEAREDYVWYERNGDGGCPPDDDIVGWAWERTPGDSADRSPPDWLLRLGPRGGLRWERCAET